MIVIIGTLALSAPNRKAVAITIPVPPALLIILTPTTTKTNLITETKEITMIVLFTC